MPRKTPAPSASAPAVGKPARSQVASTSAPSQAASDSGSKAAALAPGAKAPDFSLSATDGETVRLRDFCGRKVILYFYPKDLTPGCTKQACAFRDAAALLKKAGAVVLGVSADSAASHARFRDKHELNFTLLSDPDHQALNAYGVWKEKSLYGRRFMGIERTTFLIDEEGRIARIFPKVKVEGHAEAVLAALSEKGPR